jgi:hypothetical protein
MPKRGFQWWLIPAGFVGLVVAIPVLLLLMLIGTRLLGIFIGPVNIWNTTWHAPSAAELAGDYGVGEAILQDRTASEAMRSGSTGFRLYADHRMEIFGLPDFDGFSSPRACSYNGTGTWSATETSDVRLNLDVRDTVPGSCGPFSLEFSVIGHSAPYRIWLGAGDPDNGTGIMFVRRGR